LVLAVFATFEVYENRITIPSQSVGATLQEYHNRLWLICVFKNPRRDFWHYCEHEVSRL